MFLGNKALNSILEAEFLTHSSFKLDSDLVIHCEEKQVQKELNNQLELLETDSAA